MVTTGDDWYFTEGKNNMKKCHVKPKTIGKTIGVSETVGSSQSFLHKMCYPQVTSSPLVVMVIHDALFWIWGTPMTKCRWPQVFSACTVAGPHLQNSGGIRNISTKKYSAHYIPIKTKRYWKCECRMFLDDSYFIFTGFSLFCLFWDCYMVMTSL